MLIRFFFFDKSSDEEMSEMTCDEYLVRMKQKKIKLEGKDREEEGGKLTTTITTNIYG